MRLALFALISLAAAGQTAPLTLPAYDMFRYATAGKSLSYRFAPGGGIAPYTFSLAEGSVLPPGLRLDGATGELSGIVPQVGEYRHTVCINDAARAQICVPFLVIAVANDGDTYKELLPARVGMEYQGLVIQPGELREVDYDPQSGRLPDGMVLEITGRLYGIPRAPGGAWAFKVRGRDFEGETVIKPYLIRVLGPLAATTVMPSAFQGTPYSQRLTVLGDAPPHTWSVRRGPLPPGLILSDDGLISGVCNQPGRYEFSLRVSDTSLSAMDREMVMTVDYSLPPLEITTTPLPGASVGVAYRQQITAQGGRAPYAFRVVGSLPPGITMSPTALLTGTPTTAGTYTFTIQAQDVAGNSVLKTFTIVVGNLRYSGPTTVTVYAAEAFRQALTAEGGTAPLRFALISGTLPAGLTLSEAGVLAGTATGVPGTSTVGIRVTDASGRTVEFSLGIAVSAPRPAISANGVVNGASFAGGAIAPGQIITIFGARMGPATIAPFLLDASGRVPGALAGTRVLIGGQPAPLLYVSAGQIGAIVPYSMAGRTSVDIVVDANGVRSEAVTVPLAGAAPGLFTVDASGKGQAAALNGDGSLNGGSRPAAPGGVLVLYGTGEGQTLPAGVDGSVVGATDTPRPVLPVKVTIGGKDATVLYAGGAPGLVSGLVQVNVRVPGDVAAGDAVPVVLQVGERTSAAGVTVAIR